MPPLKTIATLYWFCSNQIPRTGIGAPELDIYITTLISIESCDGDPKQQLSIIRRRIEDTIVLYGGLLEHAQDDWLFTNYHHFFYSRSLAAAQDLIRRMEQEDWTQPKEPITPVIYTVCIRQDDEHQFQAFSTVCYRAVVFDLRSTHIRSWKVESLRHSGIRSYSDLSQEGDRTDRVLRRIQRWRPGEKIVLLFSPCDLLFPHPVTEQLKNGGYELITLV